MRKNTLIKLLAVLAMCFLIGAALVSCGEEEVDETAKTIVGVEFVGDDLVITYDDGTKTTTAIPAAAECTHENAKAYSLVDHGVRGVNDPGYAESRFVNGVILNVCNDCRKAWTTEGVLHVGYETVETAATCLEPAYVATVCQIPGCGEHFDKHPEGEIGGHVYVTTIEGDYCTGGTEVKTCSICAVGTEGHEIRTTIEATADEGFDGRHTVAEWTITKAPTFDEKGTIEGQCTKEGCLNKTVIKTLEKAVKMDNANGYTYLKSESSEIGKCGDDGIYVYKHDATGETFQVEVLDTSAPGEIYHELNGVKMVSTDQVPAGEELKYAYDYLTKGVINFANLADEISCYKAVEAHFYCTAKHDTGEECGKDIMIYVTKAHTYGGWEKVNAADVPCAKDTDYKRTCTVAGCDHVETKTFPKENCAPVYTDVLYTSNDGTDVVFDASKEANIGKVPYYKGVCKHCNTAMYKLVPEYKYEEIDAATCQADGMGKVTYKLNNGDTKTVNVVLAQFAHQITVNGVKEDIKSAEKPENADVVYYADDAKYAGLIVVTNDQKAAFEAGEKVIGYMHCDCTCTGCPAHDVTIWVKKNAPVAE